MHRHAGFSLVELMIVVAIIGVLAAIAMPQWTRMQSRAKRAELPTNVDGIKTAELGYDASMDNYQAAPTTPSSVPGKIPVDWPAGAGGFTEIGWAPDGLVRGQYGVELVGATDFKVVAQADVDGDGVLVEYTASSSVNATISGSEDVY